MLLTVRGRKLAGVRLSALAIAAIAATAAVAGTSPAVPRTPPTYAATCSDSVYQAPASMPPPTFSALRLGPVVFNHLAIRARKDVSPPTSTVRFFSVASFFNVLTSARRGVTIRIVGGDASDRLAAGHVDPALAARAIRFPLCHDTEAGTLLITQYGISFLLRKRGCFTVEVQPVGTTRRYRATIPVGVLHC
jgi:hypothetical protein